MSTPRKKRGPVTPLREERNTDPHWTNWEYLAAFGVDDLGYTYLDAIKQFCCLPSDEDVWLDELVRRARKAYTENGGSRTGQEAAWRVFRRAGMILLHDRMDTMKVQNFKIRAPRAAFIWPSKSLTIIVTTDWRVDKDVK